MAPAHNFYTLRFYLILCKSILLFDRVNSGVSDMDLILTDALPKLAKFNSFISWISK